MTSAASPGESHPAAPTAIAEAEEHLRTLTDEYSAFAGSVLGQSASLVLAELDCLRVQRDAVLALCDKFDTAWAEGRFDNKAVPTADLRRALGVTE